MCLIPLDNRPHYLYTALRMKNEMTRIGDVCDIRIGHTFRAAPSHAPDGRVLLIQPKDVSSDGILSVDQLFRVDIEASKRLRPSDVLLVNRGRFAAAVFSVDNGNTYVASSAFLILSVKEPIVLPEYIALFFNSRKGRRLIDRYVEKTTIPYIRAGNLKTMTIPIPPIEKQRIIIEFEDINRTYARLSRRKLELQRQILSCELTGQIRTRNRRKA
jgi:restriction endonuclease S subunit